MENRFSTVLETLVLHNVRKVVNAPDFVCKYFDAVIDIPAFINQVVALVRSEQRKVAAGQVRIEDRRRQIVEAEVKIDLRPASAASEESNRPPTDISNGKTNPCAYYFQRSQLDCENWNISKTSCAVPTSVTAKPYKRKPVPPYKPEYPTDVLKATVLKPVDDLSANLVDYRNYR